MMSEVNSEMSSLNMRIASFNLWNKRDQVRRDHVDNFQNNENTMFSRVDLKSASFLSLARAGFYYSDKEGVKCFCCGVEYNVWGKESPVAVHRILNLNCPLLDPNNQETSAEILFQDPATPSTDVGTLNHFCSPSRQPSDDESTPENSPRNSPEPSTSLANINLSTSTISLGPNETPPTHTTTQFVDNAEAQNVRRNLFFEAEDTETRGRVDNSENRNNQNLQIVPRRCMDHSAEFTGKIIHPKIGQKKSMVREALRLLTFPDPTDEKSEEWAKNGFRYLADEEDRVQCVYCGGQASFHENNVRNIHQRISPTGRYQCPMISGIDVGDVTRELEELVNKKLCQRNTEVSRDQRNLYPMYHPQFKTVNKRLDSFKYWPKQYKPTKTQLAEAGFFYTGAGSKVICFCCGVAILDWEPTANSWQQHALVSPKCHFTLYEKGPEFIRQIAAIQKLVDLDPSVTEPVRKIGNLVVPDPYPPTLTRDLLTAYTSCGRYPDVPMLEAASLADGQLKKQVDMLDHQIDINEKKDKQLGQIEKVLTTKDLQFKSTVCEINQRYCLHLNNKDREILEERQERQQCEQIVQQKDQQLHLKDQIVHQHREQLNQQGQQLHQHREQLHQHREQLHQTEEQLHQHREQLHQQGQQLNQQGQQLNQKEQQLCKKNRQNLLLCCTKQQLRNQLRERDSIIDQQHEELQDLSSRLQIEVREHRQREVTLMGERNEYLILSHEIEEQKREVEEEIKKYEKELSTLLNEYSRLKKKGKGDKPVESDSSSVCVFCVSRDRNIMFKPCRHICCCEECLPKFKGKPCPYCKTIIQGWQVVFLP